MLDEWRHSMYFLLGFLPLIFIGARLFLQWIVSERKKKSTVGGLYWKLSAAADLLLGLHYFIQFQYQFVLIQVVDVFISWRNLAFIKKGKKPCSFNRALAILFGVLGCALIVCFLQAVWTSHPFKLLQSPIGHLSDRGNDVHFLWEIFGLFGGVLFAMRFWVQWLQVEKSKVSELTKSFWILSLLGSVSMLIYFIRISDWVSIVLYAFGPISYIRNLMLIHNSEKSAKLLKS